jgi:hypothetical protein
MDDQTGRASAGPPALPIAATIQAFVSEYSRRYEVEDSELTRVDEPPPEPPREKRRPRERLRRKTVDEPAPGAFGSGPFERP